MKKSTNQWTGLFGLVLLITSPLAFAYRDTGVTQDFVGKGYKLTDGQATPNYWTGNRTSSGDNSKWEWKWEKVYPKFTLFCASPEGCDQSVEIGESVAVATMVGVSFAGAGKVAELTGGLTGSFQKTFTKTESFSYKSTVKLGDGKNGYAGIITLKREIKDGEIWGVWSSDSSKCKKYTRPGPLFGKTSCNYRWSNSTFAGNWSGTQNTNQRTFACSTTTVTTPANGQNLPSGCTKPALPSGWYGG